jgi:hypothetical protein
MSDEWPAIVYGQALAAHEAGSKLHLGGRIYLVRPLPRSGEVAPVLWVTDERTLGDHGLVLHQDGRVEVI